MDVAYQSVMFNGSSFDMWYSGLSSNSTATGWIGIGFASSNDGLLWTRHDSTVLTPGPPGSWDSNEVYKPSVIWNGSLYLMYYTGTSAGPSPASIGLAFSSDMIHWQKYQGNPILTPGPGLYDNYSVRFASVVYTPPLYQMWYVGRMPVNHSYSIGYATSTDGVRWVKYSGNPALSNHNLPPMNSLGPRNPSVVRFGSGYLMAFFYGGNITYAVSSDGLTWKSKAAPLIINSANNSQADMPSLVNRGSTLDLWYTDILTAGSWTVDFAVCGILVVNSTVSTTSTVSSFVTVTSTFSRAITTTTSLTLTESQLPEPWLYPTLLVAILGVVFLTTAMVFQ
jgi:predicted GH43/DUF377 family glycosyl hydrolase